MKKLICLMLCAVFIISGCGSEEFVFLSCDLDSSPQTLDPQFAESKTEQNIIANIFEGLVKRTSTGDEVPACAEKWNISQGGLVYTFTLRDDIFWSDGEKVTADDFVFAFERMFSPDAPSPFAERYDMIENSRAVMAGEIAKSSLGVKAKDDRTLVITLSAEDTGFLALLAQTSAMPCRRDFFEEQKGRYGLDKEYVLTNGCFDLYSWGSDTVKIRRSSDYRAPALIDGVDYTLSQSDAVGRFKSGDTDVCLIEAGADASGFNGTVVYDNTWALVLNPNSEAFSDKTVRMAVLGAVREKLNDRIASDARMSDGIIPPSAEVGAINYRIQVGNVPEARFADDLRSAMLDVLKEIGTGHVSSATLLVCDTESDASLGGAMQRIWQDELSVYFNMQPLNEETLAARVKSGNFDVAIAPISAENGDKTLGLSAFTALDTEGVTGALIKEAKEASRDTDSAKLLFEAEKRITEEYLALPLYDTPTVFACAENIVGVWYEPSTGIIYFDGAAAAK